MKRHSMSKFQGTMVMLTALIAVTLGMTNPSTALGAKPVTYYTDVVTLETTGDGTYRVGVAVSFYLVGKDAPTSPIGGLYLYSVGINTGDADCMYPYIAKPGRWAATTTFYDEYDRVVISYYNDDTVFPATFTYTLYPTTATVTIGNVRLFP